MTPPRRHWRSYGDDPLPTPAKALDQQFSAFPSWLLRITCDRCGKVTLRSQAHRHGTTARCARSSPGPGTTAAGKAELLTSIEGSSLPVRRIVLIEG